MNLDINQAIQEDQEQQAEQVCKQQLLEKEQGPDPSKILIKLTKWMFIGKEKKLLR